VWKEYGGMNKLLFLVILAIAIPLSTQAIAGSDKSIVRKCYKSYRNGAGVNEVAACIQTECQQKYINQNISVQMQCQTGVTKALHDLITRNGAK
jgi:hypothetical protein